MLKIHHLLSLKMIALSLLILGLASGGKAYSVTINVTKLSDTADGSCDADCSLREAIIEANSLSGTDTIILQTGTYVLSIVGIDEDLAATGDLDLTDDLILKGEGKANSIIDGDGIDRIIHVDPIGSGITVDISDLTLRNGNVTSTILENSNGGGIDNRGDLILTKVTVSNNSMTGFGSGGGLYSNGNLILNQVTIDSNRAYWAGGIRIHSGGNASIINSTVSNNRSYGGNGSGGGIWNSGNASIINSTLSGNTTAGVGGGIRNSSILDIINSTISQNSAFSGGAGILNENLLSLANVTINGNVVEVAGDNYKGGGGIFNESYVEIKNSILTNNMVAGNLNNCDGPSTRFDDFGYNLEDADTCGFIGTGSIINTDPLLGPLQNNGGSTFTHALLANSPAIDAGNPDGCKDIFPPVDLVTDQRNFVRPVDGDGDSSAICDIGAYEYGSVLSTADLSVTNSGSPNPVVKGQPLSYLIIVTNNGPNDASGVWLNDFFPSEASFVSSSTNQGSCSGESIVTCELGLLSPGQSAAVTITVTPSVDGEISNTARVYCITNDPNNTNNVSIATTNVESKITMSWILLLLF